MCGAAGSASSAPNTTNGTHLYTHRGLVCGCGQSSVCHTCAQRDTVRTRRQSHRPEAWETDGEISSLQPTAARLSCSYSSVFSCQERGRVLNSSPWGWRGALHSAGTPASGSADTSALSLQLLQSQPITAGFSQSQQVTANHSQSQPITANHSKSQPITVSHSQLEPITLNHSQSKPVTANHSKAQAITANQSLSQLVTANQIPSQPATQLPAVSLLSLWITERPGRLEQHISVTAGVGVTVRVRVWVRVWVRVQVRV